jgi:uncharacterized protein YqeY
MSIEQRINDDIRTALKAGEKIRLSVLRMVKAKIQEATVELRGKEGAEARLDDAQATAVLSTCAKQRREARESFVQGGREDLAAREEAELEILQDYLPRQLGEDEIRSHVRDAIAETGAGSLREMGAVMQVVMPKLKGAADGKLVNRVVRELLQSSQEGPS